MNVNMIRTILALLLLIQSAAPLCAFELPNISKLEDYTPSLVTKGASRKTKAGYVKFRMFVLVMVVYLSAAKKKITARVFMTARTETMGRLFALSECFFNTSGRPNMQKPITKRINVADMGETKYGATTANLINTVASANKNAANNRYTIPLVIRFPL